MARFTVQRSVDVPAPAHDVFGFVTRTENYPRFIPAYESGRVLAGEEGQPGMTFRWQTRVLGLPLSAEETIVERQEDERIAYRGKMLGAPFESSMETLPDGASTHFTVTITVDVPVRALEHVVRPLVERDVGATLSRLRSIFADGTAAQLDDVRETYSTWGKHPRWYAAQDWITFLGRPGSIRRRAAESLGLRPGQRVLEVACGTGRNLEYLERVVGGEGSIVGLDYSADMLDAARDLAADRGWRNIELVQGDAAELPVTGEFDGILCVLGMSAIPDHRRALRRCAEVLRPGGSLVVCDARLPGGKLSLLHPLIREAYGRWAAWKPDRDIPADLQHVFGTHRATVEELNFGSFFIARAQKELQPDVRPSARRRRVT